MRLTLAALLLLASTAQATTTVYGDSLVSCCLDDETWPAQLGYDPQGRAGTTAPLWWINRVEWAHHPGDRAILLLGTNDAWDANWSPMAFGSSLEAFALYLVDEHEFTRITLLHHSRVSRPEWSVDEQQWMTEKIERLHDEREAICALYDFIDCSDVIEDMDNEWKIEDSVHYSQAGHDEVARRVPEPGAGLELAALVALYALWRRRQA